MLKNLLLPHRFKAIGGVMLVIAVALTVFFSITGDESPWLYAWVFAVVADDHSYFTFMQDNILNEIIAILFIAGGLLIAFSREKKEDEFINNIRLTSLLWAVLVNYSLLLLCVMFVYGFSFMNVLEYNMFTVLIIFIARFHYILYRTSKAR